MTTSAVLLLALMAVPVVGAVIVALVRGSDVAARGTALGFSFIELALAAAVWASYQPGGARLQMVSSADWIAPVGVHLSFGVDGIALVMVAVIALLVPIVIGFSWNFQPPTGRSLGSFLSLLLLQQGLMVGVFAATDVFLFYVLFEIMLIPMYFLIGGYGGQRRQYAAVKFFLYSFLGGLLMLASAIGAYVYAADKTGSGTFDWQTLVGVMRDAPLSLQIWLFLGFFAAFAIKAPLVPFHTWLPDAASEAPIGVAVILVGVLDKVGTFGFLRYNLALFPAASQELAPWVLALAVAGVLYGALLAVGQRDMQRMIAYVSISHFGFIALGIFAFSSQAQAGAVTYMVNHSIATGMLLLLIGMVAARGGSRLISDYGGMARVTPVLGGLFLVAGLTTLSLPGTNSFISEFLVLLGSFPREPVFTVVAALGMVLAALYVLWLYQRVFHGPVRGTALVEAAPGPGAVGDPARAEVPDLSKRELVVLAPLVVAVLGLGVYPKPLLDVVTPSVGATMTEAGVTDPVTAQGGK
ncbi:NADH-quinone oxidoreductase subunit M [Longimycelium tulufanense]|uniref:NADH-quinone oxidoreductase subunit M n=1 Tax=Longimycelium tulufanense TaxID=907463 RepID=A0A8J3CFF3_9PSEU|nr:NADH-quinone oxidoreductase subunit M [Longimycelium tulufanense]GGM52532.1 NADH-quinone oxidoreductase subunit M [Longimycelium tulufanense]